MENRRPYWQVAVSLVFSLLATAAFIIIGVKAIVFFMPFVIGWCISAIAAPVVNWLEKHFKIVKKLGSALIVVLVIGLIVLLIYLAVSRLVTEVGDLLKNIPDLYEQLASGLSQIGQSMSGLFARLPEEVRSGFQTMMSNLNEYMGDLISKIGEPTVTAAGNLAMRLPFFLVSVLVSVISAYFFTVERDEVLNWAKKVMPQAVVKRMTLVMDNLRYAVGGYFKAQFKIMGVVFLILMVGFALLKINYFALIAFLIAFLDFLPFFGTGTAMIPWALYKFLVGDYKTAPNEVGGMNTTLPEDVAGEMEVLLSEYNAKGQKTLEDILEFHVKFEKIHPFQDGNGRVGRLIMFKECLKYSIVPFIIQDELKMFYYRGLKEWNHEKGYLTDTCLTAQDKYKTYLDYFRISYEP